MDLLRCCRPLFVVLIVLGLLCSPCNARAQQAQPFEGVSLDAPPVWWSPKDDHADGKSRSGSLVARELTRQALLIAARDELGLLTLDALLGESGARERIMPLSLAIEMTYYGGSQVTVRHGEQTLVDEQVPTPWLEYRDLVIGVEQNEALSRGAWLDALREAGLDGPANLWEDAAPVPEHIHALADQLSLVPQFRAARALHGLIRNEGESPERLWMLSRVYANLAQESRWFIRPQYAAFQVRSFLYARRLQVKAPEHPLSRLAVAYTYTLAGYPNYAQADAEALEQQLAALPADQAPPTWAGWLELVQACRQHDQAALDGIMQAGGPHAAIAALWGVYTNQFVEMDSLTFDAIDKAMQVNPLSTRNLYAGYDAMGVRAGHWLTEAVPDHFSRVTAQTLGQINVAPAAVGVHLRDLHREAIPLREMARFGRALQDTTQHGEDIEEFSYAILGTLIGEANALHIAYRASFLRRQLAVDAGGYLRQVDHALARHPFKPLVLAFRHPKHMRTRGMLNLMHLFRPAPINRYNLYLFSRHLPDDGRFANGWTDRQWWRACYASGLEASGEWLLAVRRFDDDDRANRADYARRMNGYDSHHPQRIALALENPKLRDKQLIKLAAQYGQHPLVASALARAMQWKGDLKAALQYAELAAELAPERGTVEQQAKIELARGNEANWLALMESILELPDHGLDHAAINKTIAHTYMNAGRYEDALAYAKASARSGAQWGYKVSAINLACLGRHAEARQFGERIDQRYGQDNHAEKHIQVWAGTAEPRAVLNDFENYFKRFGGDEGYGWRLLYAELTLGLFEEGLQRVESTLDRSPDGMSTRELLFGVTAAQYLDKPELRDRLLDKLIHYKRMKDGKRYRFSLLGDIIKKALMSGEIDWDAAEQWTRDHDPYAIEVPGNLGIIGLTFDKERQRAEAELLRLAKRPAFDSNMTNIARATLRQEGYTNAQMLPTGFEDAHTLPAPAE